MLKIGITGGIGSGKSTISKVFEVLGIPVFYADDQAKQVMTDDPVLVDAIKTTFGNSSYFDDGLLNRKYIAGIVFNDAEKLQMLNAIVHPAVFRAFDKWVLNQSAAAYVLKEAALLFESDSYKMCNKTIMVYAPRPIRMARVMARDGVSLADVESRDAKQFTDEKKMQLSDFIIKNDDTELVIPQVLALHQEFLKIAGAQ